MGRSQARNLQDLSLFSKWRKLRTWAEGGQPQYGVGCAQALVVRVIQGNSAHCCPPGLSTWGRPRLDKSSAYLKIREKGEAR